VGGYYKLLGGKIKGNCKFKFELGKLCEFVAVNKESSSAVEGLTVISDITPADGRQGIDVFNAPQVVFNYQVNKPFSISEDNNSKESYKVILDHFKVLAADKELAGSYDWNQNGDVLVFNPRDILPGKTKINLETQIHFEELKGTIWQPVKDSSVVITETRIVSFETGEAPDFIPENNVRYSYPLNKMMNFYKNEYGTGYIQLLRGQEYLFTTDSKWRQYIRFTPTGRGDPLFMNLSYQSSDKLISHQFPANLVNNTMYRLEIVNIPAESAGAIDQNIQSVTTLTSTDAGDMQKTEKKATGELNIPGEKVIYESYFRTSIYNTFVDKVNALNIPQGYTYPIAQGIYEVGGRVNGNEIFDDFELNGSSGTLPLVQFTADENGTWLRYHAYPIIYEGYPLQGNIFIYWRNTSELGIVPLKAIGFRYISGGLTTLTNDDFNAGIAPAVNFSAQLIYKLNINAVYDWDDIIVGAFRAKEYTPRITGILENPCPAILFNTSYPVKATYRLPGIEKVTNNATINLKVL
jgi:hypothetical protein